MSSPPVDSCLLCSSSPLFSSLWNSVIIRSICGTYIGCSCFSINKVTFRVNKHHLYIQHFYPGHVQGLHFHFLLAFNFKIGFSLGAFLVPSASPVIFPLHLLAENKVSGARMCFVSWLRCVSKVWLINLSAEVVFLFLWRDELQIPFNNSIWIN